MVFVIALKEQKGDINKCAEIELWNNIILEISIKLWTRSLWE